MMNQTNKIPFLLCTYFIFITYTTENSYQIDLDELVPIEKNEIQSRNKYTITANKDLSVGMEKINVESVGNQMYSDTMTISVSNDILLPMDSPQNINQIKSLDVDIDDPSKKEEKEHRKTRRTQSTGILRNLGVDIDNPAKNEEETIRRTQSSGISRKESQINLEKLKKRKVKFSTESAEIIPFYVEDMWWGTKIKEANVVNVADQKVQCYDKFNNGQVFNFCVTMATLHFYASIFMIGFDIVIENKYFTGRSLAILLSFFLWVYLMVHFGKLKQDEKVIWKNAFIPQICLNKK